MTCIYKRAAKCIPSSTKLRRCVYIRPLPWLGSIILPGTFNAQANSCTDPLHRTAVHEKNNAHKIYRTLCKTYLLFGDGSVLVRWQELLIRAVVGLQSEIESGCSCAAVCRRPGMVGLAIGCRPDPGARQRSTQRKSRETLLIRARC